MDLITCEDFCCYRCFCNLKSTASYNEHRAKMFVLFKSWSRRKIFKDLMKKIWSDNFFLRRASFSNAKKTFSVTLVIYYLSHSIFILSDNIYKLIMLVCSRFFSNKYVDRVVPKNTQVGEWLKIKKIFIYFVWD